MNRVYYNQADERWASHPYPSSAYPKATIKSGGCGATSAAMIISSFVKTIYPNEMGDIFRNNGLRYATGTAPVAFEWIAKTYGLKIKKTLYIADAVECLKNGGMVVAYCKAGGLFSTGGHIIVLADIRNDNLVVYDPYLYANKFKNGNKKCVSVNGNEAIVSVANFKKYCDYTLYCYDSLYPEKTSIYKQGDAIEVHIPVELTGATQGDDVMVDTNGYQYWVHKSVIQNKQIIARAVVAYASDESYLIQIFNRQFWCNEKYIAKKLD